MDPRVKEAVNLFEEVMIYGTEQVLKSMDPHFWQEYSPEQLQLLKLLQREGRLTSGRLAALQAVHKSAISGRTKKLLQKGLIRIVETPDRRSRLFELTPEGQQLVGQAEEMTHEYVQQLFIRHVEDEEIEQFLQIFRKLKTIIKTEGAE
ncbi:MarR family winged helix-turn-helix transcriptional regulator [Planococcus lenghuensis]|uniref:MarR family transcriptional regulator n=1 Tax=Planococcus lenghuensis TaxID=2213202 RepID=A0A1Q2KV04_9BACL|nr:MarR family transcriptional regulator [Planococcus lenghuensis]AQQ52019.1 MarR family transcriptional regulator [Planococcus lenghuensis]